jgi:hypothetical protein
MYVYTYMRLSVCVCVCVCVCARLSNSAIQVPLGTPGKEAPMGRGVANSQLFFWHAKKKEV